MEREKTYTVLARRYRPVSFDEVVGQEHVAQTLRNAIADGRVGHAYLFSGPRGVGKTSTARLLAKALNCAEGISADPCNKCEICLAVQDGTDTDVIEMDAASNRGVDDARALREGVRYAPLRSRHKIYIIDEAHMLTREAFNTLLKTLEEPPPHVKFIFATTEPHKIPDTIASRCQRFDFRRITAADILKRLKQIVTREKLHVDDAVLDACARAARGSMRDGESVLDQLLAFKEKGLTAGDVSALLGAAAEDRIEAIVAALKAADPGAALTALDAVFAGGLDPAAFTDQMIEHVRTLMVIQACGRTSPVVDLPDHLLESCVKQSAGFSLEAFLYFIQILFEARRRIREGANPRIVLEVSLVKMAKAGDLVSVAEALKGAQNAPVTPAPPIKPPSPEPPPPAPEENAAPPSSIEEFARAWPRLVAEVKKSSMVAGALLAQCRPIKMGAAEIEIQVPQNLGKIQVDNLKQPKHTGAIETVLHRIFGRRTGIRVTLESGGASAAEPRRPSPSSDLAADPSVRKVLDAFPGSRVDHIE
ncbi:MAG: DNA polymerase III subunit gamma/tau [Planctomycetes bacterium]|nr:DNA polymerase III subunit gamma/tau [Planctomycetota bacterium]